MKKILIDTNIYSSAMRGDREVISILKKMEEIGISAISVGELLSGFKGGTRESKNRVKYCVAVSNRLASMPPPKVPSCRPEIHRL